MSLIRGCVENGEQFCMWSQLTTHMLTTNLQRPYDEIMITRQLFNWASTNIPAVHFDYCTNEGYLKEQLDLEERFQESRTIPGTRILHSFIPISDATVQVRPFSASTTFKEEKVTSQEAEISFEQISGFVTCVREGRIGC